MLETLALSLWGCWALRACGPLFLLCCAPQVISSAFWTSHSCTSTGSTGAAVSGNLSSQNPCTINWHFCTTSGVFLSLKFRVTAVVQMSGSGGGPGHESSSLGHLWVVTNTLGCSGLAWGLGGPLSCRRF